MDFTLREFGEHYPDGTLVGAYREADLPGGVTGGTEGILVGVYDLRDAKPVAIATAAGGEVHFTGLEGGVTYVAVGAVDGDARYAMFQPMPAALGDLERFVPIPRRLDPDA